jgi:hypothetical protein
VMHRQAVLMSSEQQEPVMNSFYDHHKDSIGCDYRCFDRILLNGLVQPFQQPERVVGFFDVYRLSIRSVAISCAVPQNSFKSG